MTLYYVKFFSTKMAIEQGQAANAVTNVIKLVMVGSKLVRFRQG
jgi:hypothetical protein